MNFPDWQHDRWIDVSDDPLISPPDSQQNQWLKPTDTPSAEMVDDSVVGDPQVILPGEFDDLWHLFCIGRGYFYRFDSSDGRKWSLVSEEFWNSGPACITCDGSRWYAFYSHHAGWPESADSSIVARTSTDLMNWSEPVPILAPELEWEREGPAVQLRNPSVALLPSGEWRLYYSGGTVLMHDMGFEEPKYVGLATADDPLGPYVRRTAPVLRPDLGLWYRNHGAGAMKVYRYGDVFLGLANGIYHDDDGNTRSAIDVLLSDDGVTWIDAPYNPIIRPATAWWKNALIYQLDLRWHDGKLWMFYNARAGWADAKEYIGASTLNWNGPRPEKLWALPS